MSEMKCISDFQETMDHEFPEYNLALAYQGYKVDGSSGIKKHCDLNGFKSVDYFYEKSHQQEALYFIEFSDLRRHKDSVEQRISEVERIDGLNSKTKKKILKTIGCEIHQELRAKYTDSLHILSKISTHIENVPPIFECDNSKIIFHVIVPPLPISLEKDKLADLIRFYEILRDKIFAVIPSQMIANVRVYPVSKISVNL